VGHFRPQAISGTNRGANMGLAMTVWFCCCCSCCCCYYYYCYYYRLLFNWHTFWNFVQVIPVPKKVFQRRTLRDCWCVIFLHDRSHFCHQPSASKLQLQQL